MKTFVIHTPKPTDQSGNRSFEATIETCTGEEFAIYRNIYDQLHEGMPLIVLDKLQRQQAEAIVTRIEFQPNATKRVARYNVLFHNPRRVAYRGDEIKLNRCGVALLDSQDSWEWIVGHSYNAWDRRWRACECDTVPAPLPWAVTSFPSKRSCHPDMALVEASLTL